MKVGRAERRAPSRPTMDPRTWSHSPRPLSLCCCEGLGQRQGQGLAGLRAPGTQSKPTTGVPSSHPRTC